MSWLKLLSMFASLAETVRKMAAKANKDRYEQERTTDINGPADRFEHEFSAGVLGDSAKVQRDKANAGKGG
ncbi:MAG: hypothetical protein ACRCVX_02380 [Shewanella sp.]